MATRTRSQREPAHFPVGYQPIEDYGMIGDLQTVALVGKNGSIDWYCVPSFDGPSVFAALLDAQKGGYFQIAPASLQQTSVKQLYLPETNIPITPFSTPDGIGEVTDFMPITDPERQVNRHQLIREIHVVHGT